MHIEPFTVEVPDEALVDLKRRLDNTRWIDPGLHVGWELGIDDAVLRRVHGQWQTEFDWRQHEHWLNRYQGLRAEADDGSYIHLIRARDGAAGGFPLVLLHGWPSTPSEFRYVVEPLTDPVAHNGSADDAFDVVLVSLPGFGFSGPTRTPGWDMDRMADAIAAALAQLGIDAYGVFGTDAGAYVATSLAARHPDAVVGLHLQLGGVSIARNAGATLDEGVSLSEVEQQALKDLERYERVDSAYASLNTTKPHTLAYALGDSPVGQAAWILEKFHTWTEPTDDAAPFGKVSIDDALAIVTTYWLTGTAASAARFYAETAVSLARRGLPRVDVPTACAVFPGDIVRPSRRWAERSYPRVVRWTEMTEGGHFGAFEAPDLLVEDLREFFRALR